jgi:GNAT superfamily N-acetyltransferase
MNSGPAVGRSRSVQSTVSIRRAGEPDADAIAQVHLRSAGVGFSDFLPASQMSVTTAVLAADWRARLSPDEESTRTTFVAEDGHAVVGVLFAALDADDPTVGRVARLYVDPDYWTQGVAGHLLSTCLGDLRDRGCRVARAWVMEPNTRARAVIEGLGARVTGARQPTCEGAASVPDGVEDVEYALVLSAEPGEGPG